MTHTHPVSPLITPTAAIIMGTLTLLAALTLMSPTATHASAPSLQVAPLQYEDTFTPGQAKTGFIDVANPTDTTIRVTSSLAGFRQVGDAGEIEFYDDPDLTAAITLGLADFTLGPREAVRTTFTVNTTKLGTGTTTATIFFTTQPPDQTSATSYVAQSARIGTHLILTNAANATPQGRFANLRIPFWQIGAALTGSYAIENTDRSSHPLAFRPQVQSRVLPWSSPHSQATGLITGGTTRTFQLSQRGSYFGPLPLTLTDRATRASSTIWVFAVTGYWRWLAPLLALVIVVLLLPARWFGIKPPRHPQAKRLIDGLQAVKPLDDPPSDTP